MSKVKISIRITPQIRDLITPIIALLARSLEPLSRVDVLITFLEQVGAW